MLTAEQIDALRHPSEKSRFTISVATIVPAILLTVALIAASLGTILILVLIIYVSVWLASQIIFAWYLSNTARASQNTFPTVHRAIEDAKSIFGYDGDVIAYVVEDGSYNALIFTLLRRKFLIINSEVLAKKSDEIQMRFIVGRFIGSLATKKYRLDWLQTFIDGFESIKILNILLYPYERATQYSGDQMGLYMIGNDLKSGVSALLKLTVGSSVSDQVNVKDFVEQGRENRNNFFLLLARLTSRFPHMTDRVENLVEFSVKRYPASLPKAPLRAKATR